FYSTLVAPPRCLPPPPAPRGPRGDRGRWGRTGAGAGGRLPPPSDPRRAAGADLPGSGVAPEERREEGAALREGHCDAGPEVQGGAVDVSGVPDGVLSGFACCRCLTLLQVPDTGRLGKIETKVFCSFLFLGALAGPRDRQKTTRDEKFSTLRGAL
ncbi:unnamed protein product, partial [Prorocentrum cordatum]